MGVVIYEKLFDVKFYHEYYDSFNIADIDIVLPRSTEQLILMYCLVFRATAEGFVVMCKKDKAYLLEQLKSRIQFTFYLKMKNRFLGNFTLLDHQIGREKYCFNNYDPSQLEQTDSNSRYQLHENETAHSFDIRTCLQPNSLIETSIGIGEGVFRKNAEVVFQGEISESDTASTVLGQDYGLYNVIIDSDDKQKEVYYTPALVPEIFGIVDMYLGKQENILFETVRNRSFEIRFKNRSVFWVYYLISNSDRVLDRIRIGSGKSMLTFSEPEQVTLINGKQAVRVMSEGPLPLKKFYNGDKLFATISNSSSEISEKKIRLPMPDVNKVKGSFSSGIQKYYSEMYVYI
ncbi:MAG: hypothetical protein HN728_06335 [Flavobacteriales bacterium]|jgi:hypothetical protein|nr:hypothetical protein [Flavobacteriales bacterium]MBT6916007.1 hypothetical protein [Flavobacteriales bacterium]MBT7687086.1 hypothetical protein [Flavobacteriales bacterium]MBT7749440.1 hypothetical protein [Flavobacteriales bacterium]